MTSQFAAIDKRLSQRRILTLDIERIPGRFKAQWRGLTVEGDFWDLKDGRRHIGRYIFPDEVVEWPATICAAWRVYGQRTYGFSSTWGASDLTEDLAEQLDKADIVVGHNVDQFDLKKINAMLLLNGRRPPSSFKTIDTLKVLRSRMGLESNTLRSACDRLGIKTKVDHYDPDVAKAAVDGDVAAQRRIERYNKGDIAATEALYEALRPWISTHPPVVADSEGLRCRACGSDRFERTGSYLADVNEYAEYACQDCGAPFRAGHVRRVTRTRGVR